MSYYKVAKNNREFQKLEKIKRIGSTIIFIFAVFIIVQGFFPSIPVFVSLWTTLISLGLVIIDLALVALQIINTLEKNPTRASILNMLNEDLQEQEKLIEIKTPRFLVFLSKIGSKFLEHIIFVLIIIIFIALFFSGIINANISPDNFPKIEYITRVISYVAIGLAIITNGYKIRYL